MEKPFYTVYRPITPRPLRNGPDYREIPPSPILAPYIRCFWGTESAYGDAAQNAWDYVIPDTCVDIIFSGHPETGFLRDVFCGVNDRAYRTESGHQKGEFLFGIRFYAWSAHLFSQRDMRFSLNTHGESGVYFGDLADKMKQRLLESQSLEERKSIAEAFLLSRLRQDRRQADLMNILDQTVRTAGNLKAEEIASSLSLSLRQTERLFDRAIGVTPKKMLNLMRYQMAFQEMARLHRVDFADLAAKHGYCDQAHLIRDFQKYHRMTPLEAMEYAKKR